MGKMILGILKQVTPHVEKLWQEMDLTDSNGLISILKDDERSCCARLSGRFKGACFGRKEVLPNGSQRSCSMWYFSARIRGGV